MASGKYLSLEEAHNAKNLDRFANENPFGNPKVENRVIELRRVQTQKWSAL